MVAKAAGSPARHEQEHQILVELPAAADVDDGGSLISAQQGVVMDLADQLELLAKQMSQRKPENSFMMVRVIEPVSGLEIGLERRVGRDVPAALPSLLVEAPFDAHEGVVRRASIAPVRIAVEQIVHLILQLNAIPPSVVDIEERHLDLAFSPH